MKWFMHESSASRDARIRKLKMKYGADGIALYWTCLEEICAAVDPKLTFELESDAELLAADLSIDTLRVEEIMRYMVDLGLFESSEGVITCLKLAKYLGDKNTRNPELKKVIHAQKGLTEEGVPVGYVYMIGAGNRTKIGFSKNPWSRVGDFKGKHPDAKLLVSVKGTIQDEKSVHAAFSQFHDEGEWFRIPDDFLQKAADCTTLGDLISMKSLLRSSDVELVSALEERRGEEKREEEKNTSPPKGNDTQRIPYKKVQDLWNEICVPAGLPECKILNAQRKSNIRQRHIGPIIKGDMAEWKDYFAAITTSPFLTGKVEGKNWRADFDFAISDRGITRTFEGKYHG